MPTAKLEKNIYSNLFSRTFGGTVEPGVADLFITGYGYFWFDKLPPKLPEYIPDMSITDIKQTLAALCKKATPPTETLNKTTQTGLGGKKWGTPTNIDVGDTVPLTFFEISGTPVKKIIGGWVKMIRDMRHGASNLEGDDYTKSQYSASAYHILTKPDGKTIESVMLFTGLFPQRNPLENYEFDLETNDKIQIDIDFNVDNVWDDFEDKQAFILNKAESIIDIVAQAKQQLLTWSM